MQEVMTRKVASLESHMDAKVNKAVQLALSQRGTAGSLLDVVISRSLSDAVAVHPQRRPTYKRNSNPRLSQRR